MSREEWFRRGVLKKPRKGIDLSFWRLVIFINWAKDWTWASVQEDGDLKHVIVGITKTQRIGTNGEILNAYGIYCLKISVVFGFA